MNLFRTLPYFILIVLLFSACGSGGNNVDPPNTNYPESRFFEEGLTILKKNGKQVVLNREGKQIELFNEKNILAEFGLDGTNAQLSSLSYFREGFSEVFLKTQEGIRWGYINKKGENPFGKMFEYAGVFEKGLSVIKENGKWGIIDTKGNYLVEPKYKGVSSAGSSDRYWAKEDGKWTLFELQSHKPISRIPIRIMGGFNDKGVCWVEKRTADDTKVERAFMDKNGRVLSPWYDNANDFSEGLASFERNGKWGFVGEDGQVVIDAQFGYVGTFSNGVAGYTSIIDGAFGKWGIINKRGDKILPMVFPWFSSCKNGTCMVRGDNGKSGFATKKGNWITEAEYDNIYEFSEGLAAVNKGKLWGFINEKGEQIIDFKYKKVVPFPDDPFNGGFSGGMAKVESDGTEFLIDKSGNCVFGCLE